jgi:hypothetical protein
VATSTATTTDAYIASLPEDRQVVVRAIRDEIRRNLPDGYAEGMQYGMIGWYVPLERFPNTYNGQPLGLVGLASQKQYVSLYLNSVYGDRDTEAWFRERWAGTGKALNMGKSCVRLRRLEDVPLDVIGETIARADLDSYLAQHEEARGSSRVTKRRPGVSNP